MKKTLTNNVNKTTNNTKHHSKIRFYTLYIFFIIYILYLRIPQQPHDKTLNRNYR